MSIICLIISICLFIFSFYQIKKANLIKINKHEEQQNILKQIQQQQFNKEKNLISINNQIKNKNNELNQINKIKQQHQEEIEKNQKRLKDFQQISNQASKSYIKNLENSYKTAETAYQLKITRLKNEYTQAAAELQKIKDTKKAAYQALLKQRQIKENSNNYRLLPNPSDLSDINSLLKIKKELHKPRILSMLIWQSFWQPLAKQKFPIILQSKTKTGIYKITNIKTNQCYIGQSLDIYKRWNEHCKAGLGIDTPPGNKLYKAIQEQGLQNFTFQLLIECNKEELNEKERYFIELYQADTFGYNGTGGNR